VTEPGLEPIRKRWRSNWNDGDEAAVAESSALTNAERLAWAARTRDHDLKVAERASSLIRLAASAKKRRESGTVSARVASTFANPVGA